MTTRKPPKRLTKPPRPTAPRPETFEAPTSTNIARASYRPWSGEMTIQFKKAGAALASYSYQGVPGALWGAFKASTSKGGFFAAEIRTQYPGVKCE